MTTTKPRVDYSEYITSDAWRSKHGAFLKAAHYRCSATPWVRCGQRHRYNAHHVSYQNLGHEKYWWDVVILSPFAHNHLVHGVLSAYKRPSQQKRYPNTAQSLFHQWCRLPAFLKLAIVCLCLSLLGVTAATVMGINSIVGGVLGAIVFILLLM